MSDCCYEAALTFATRRLIVFHTFIKSKCWCLLKWYISIYYLLNVNKIRNIIHPCIRDLWNAHPTEKIKTNNNNKIIPIGKNRVLLSPLLSFWSEFAVPAGLLGLKRMEINISSYKIGGIIYPHLDICSKVHPRKLWNFHLICETTVLLLIFYSYETLMFVLTIKYSLLNVFQTLLATKCWSLF